MKRYLFSAILVLFIVPQLKALDCKYDERIELLGIICNLAGLEEYNHGWGRDYINDVDSLFASYSAHPAVKMMQRLNRENGIGYDAPMQFALNLAKRNDRFIVINDSIEQRWNGVDLQAVADTVTGFYNDTRFGTFFNAHKSFYQSRCSQFNDKVLAFFNRGWYTRFYGCEPAEDFNVLIGFLNGGCNYGPSLDFNDRPRQVFAIMGYVMRRDSLTSYEAQPDVYREILVHEFNHSFINHLIDHPQAEFVQAMEAPGLGVKNLSETVMTMQAYSDWMSIINESIVRAAVVCYLIDNGTVAEDIRNAIRSEIQQGFVWMPELVQKLKEYKAHRDKYPTFEDFYPQIIRFFTDYVASREDAITQAAS